MFNFITNGTRSTSYAYDAVTGACRAIGDDVDGNLTTDDIRVYPYNAFNRLAQAGNAFTSAVLATYVYDASGRRIYTV